MSPEAQREAIARACGYSYFRSKSTGIYQFSIWLDGVGDWERVESLPDQWEEGGNYVDRICPDFLNDLNAVHEAEKSLSDHEHEAFRGRLRERVLQDSPGPWERDYPSATATQRCEAFLRAKRLWAEPQQPPTTPEL